MKKALLLVLACGLSLSANADQKLCGYKDFFHLSDTTHPGIFIMSANSNSDINVQIIGPKSFELRDTIQCHTGYAHVTVAADAFNWCVLDLKDGPFMPHPTVSASCMGLVYEGMTYDGFNSYSYSLNFA